MIKNILGKIQRKKGKVTGYPAPDDDLFYQTKTRYPLHFETTASNETQSDDELPSLIDAPNAEKRNLFLRKLSLCCVVFDFTDPSSDSREKEIKRLTLIELVHYITSEKVRFDALSMQQIVVMVSVNLFRPLITKSLENKAVDDFDLEEEEYLMDPAWTHLQVVYEFLLRFVVSRETDANMAKHYIDHSFITSLLDLFDSEDPRERKYLKNILHRIYGKFMGHRPFIRKAISYIFYGFIYETEKRNGIAELLEILGSIVNGFVLPLREEHKLFLVRTLIPLHKPKCISMYHGELSYCIKGYVEKDSELADAVIRGILKYWPITNSSKEVLLLGEIEEVLESTQATEFQKFMVPLFRQIARCCLSSQFQVAERALVLWSNDHIKNLITQNHKVILPIIVPALERNTRGHWNQSVKSLTLNVNKFFYDADPDFFEECLLKFQEDEAREQDDKMKREAMWRHLLEMALQRMAEKRNLFLRKLSLCCVVFDFTDPSSNSREKEIKRLTLIELVDYITSEKEIFDGSSMEEIVRMVSVNLFRPIVTKSRENILVDEFDREEKEYLMDPAWTHLRIVYEFLLRFVVSPETDAKMAKRYIDRCFITSLLDLFDSDDPRERKYLKNILHRIYGKFMLHRPFIRKAISNIFYGFIYETERHNGIAELLEILGSIINGFVLPLREEHKLFLVRALIPLHKPKCISMYHGELSYCIKGYVEKDSELADAVIRGILKYWPITNSSKEVLLLGEIEDVLESTQAAEFQKFMVPLFRQIARCCLSSQFQVAERALVLWSNDHIKNLITQNHKVILPIIVPALERNTRGHWYLSVKSLTLGVVKSFYDADPVFFRECLQKFQEGEAREEYDKLNREATWRRLEEMARARN